MNIAREFNTQEFVKENLVDPNLEIDLINHLQEGNVDLTFVINELANGITGKHLGTLSSPFGEEPIFPFSFTIDDYSVMGWISRNAVILMELFTGIHMFDELEKELVPLVRQIMEQEYEGETFMTSRGLRVKSF